jgi:hypothetical protein
LNGEDTDQRVCLAAIPELRIIMVEQLVH